MSQFRLRCAMFCSALIGGSWSFGTTAEVDCLGSTPIFEIQGKTHVSPYNGVTVETCGVVTAVAFNGYYLQDPVGDSDDETSDRIIRVRIRPETSSRYNAETSR
jgi:predicted extracellular nuclease